MTHAFPPFREPSGTTVKSVSLSARRPETLAAGPSRGSVLRGLRRAEDSSQSARGPRWDRIPSNTEVSDGVRCAGDGDQVAMVFLQHNSMLKAIPSTPCMPYLNTLGGLGGQCKHIWQTWSVLEQKTVEMVKSLPLGFTVLQQHPN